jgi:ATP-dependent RNA helicase DeaD
MEKFKQLGISEHTLEAIKKLGFENPSEIQEKSIPLVLEGKDVIAGASTGSGKTLAFGTGVIHNSETGYGVQGLILTPTRELAEQITKELRKFTGEKKLKIISVYGGMSMLKQIKELETAEIVVGTPGRILDHLLRRTLNLQYIRTLVLDEADRMFDMGFRDDVEKIISQCPKERQTLLYSATISNEIVGLAEKHMKNPTEVSAEVYVDPSKLSQIYYDISDGLKFSLLKHLLENEKSELVMVFCNTRRNVDFVVNNLKEMDIEALPIHGGYSQEKRNKIMKIFHSNKVHVLVCTDVAARGLDIKNVTHIYNYDIPNEAKEYVHRIGRTARAGEEGRVINIITSRDYDNFSEVLKHNPEFEIKSEEKPYIKRVELKWIPEGRGRRTGGNSRFGSSRSSSGRQNNRRGGMSGSARRDARKRRDRGERDNNRENQRDRKPRRDHDRRPERSENKREEGRRRSYSKKGYEKRAANRAKDGGRRSEGRPNRSKGNVRSKPGRNRRR